jgi:hypothetical protein
LDKKNSDSRPIRIKRNSDFSLIHSSSFALQSDSDEDRPGGSNSDTDLYGKNPIRTMVVRSPGIRTLNIRTQVVDLILLSKEKNAVSSRLRCNNNVVDRVLGTGKDFMNTFVEQVLST